MNLKFIFQKVRIICENPLSSKKLIKIYHIIVNKLIVFWIQKILCFSFLYPFIKDNYIKYNLKKGNFKIIINNLENKIFNQQKENSQLKSNIQKLKESYLNLKSDYSLLQTKYHSILSKEINKESTENKNKEILQLKDTI